MLEHTTAESAIQRARLALKAIPRIEDVVAILLFGATGAGKSSLGNLASNTTQLPVGDDLQSCTKEAQITDMFVVNQRPVIMVDLPGFDDTLQSNADLLAHIVAFLNFLCKSKIKILGLLYLHPISHNRFQGSDARNFHLFREICGPSASKNIVFATTMWSKPPTQRELSREEWLRESDIAFKDVLSAGAQITRHSEETRESALNILQLVLNKGPIVPQVSRQMIDEGKHLEQTNAGQALGKEFQDYVRATQEEIERLEAEHNREQERLRIEQQKKIDAERRAREAAEERLRNLQRMREEEARRWERERAAAESHHGGGGCIVV